MSLELIIGPMFAGKSSAALQRIRRAEVLGRKIIIITSIMDTRYDMSGCVIKTHDNDGRRATGLKDLREALTLTEYHQAELVIIEEAQFFQGLYHMVKRMVEVDKKKVIVIGLDGDSDRMPFGEVLTLVPIADTITKLTALCKRCASEGKETPGLFSALKGTKTEQICVGGGDTYEALCRWHYLNVRELVIS
jgi:thymidine kinase